MNLSPKNAEYTHSPETKKRNMAALIGVTGSKKYTFYTIFN